MSILNALKKYQKPEETETTETIQEKQLALSEVSINDLLPSQRFFYEHEIGKKVLDNWRIIEQFTKMLPKSIFSGELPNVPDIVSNPEKLHKFLEVMRDFSTGLLERDREYITGKQQLTRRVDTSETGKDNVHRDNGGREIDISRNTVSNISENVSNV